MATFGAASKRRLAELHPDLRRVLLTAIKIMDFSVIEGFRGQVRQHECFLDGSSKVDWPDSKHNTSPSRAADVCPYRGGLQWDDREAFYLLGGILKAVAYQLGIKIRVGLDWDGDNDTHDQTFHDLPHVELG